MHGSDESLLGDLVWAKFGNFALLKHLKQTFIDLDLLSVNFCSLYLASAELELDRVLIHVVLFFLWLIPKQALFISHPFLIFFVGLIKVKAVSAQLGNLLSVPLPQLPGWAYPRGVGLLLFVPNAVEFVRHEDRLVKLVSLQDLEQGLVHVLLPLESFVVDAEDLLYWV